MCKLKHLAVAAAIVGLATQVQAGYFPGSTDFEGADTLSDGLWSNAVDVAIEVDATIGSTSRASNRPSTFDANSRTKVLSVDSDDPVVRYLQEGRTAPTADTIYADALVKGHPLASDAPVPEVGPNDKIFVYTRVNATGTDTNLCVLAKPDASSLTNEYVFTSTHIGKDSWHRVIIEAVSDGTYKVYCDAFGQNALGTYYPINGGSSMSSVAFAGTGSVDDLILSTWEPEKPVYTLTWREGFDSVSYTLNGVAGDPLTAADGEYAFQADPNATIVLTGVYGNRTNSVTGTSLQVSLNPAAIDMYFPQTATAGQDGTVAHPFEIADVGDLLALQAAVQTTNCADICFVQVANIDFASEAAFEGIGTYAETSPSDGKPFSGIYDGQNYTISNVTFTDRSYAGVFNQVDGTIKNLTVSNLTFVGTGSKYSASIVGNAGNGATLRNLVAAGSFGSSEKPGNHNMAGIVIRACGGGANGTLVKDCTNNAAIYGTYTKMAGICAITQHKVDGGPITFDGCVNNGNLTMPSGDTAGCDGLAGIVGYVSDNTVLKDCQNADSCTITSTFADARIGQLVGYAYNYSLTDQGGNRADYVKKMIGFYGTSTVTNFQYATISGGVATTVTTLSKNTAYRLEANITASETPVFTLAIAGDYIGFDTQLGYTFEGTVAAVEGLNIATNDNGFLTIYTAYRTAPPGFNDPEGNPIDNQDVNDWLADSGFTQANINALGNDAAATEKLHECYLLNCDITAQDPGGRLSITDITVSNNVSLTVQLVRKAPLGHGVIQGKLCFYGATDLAAGFVGSPIPDANVEFWDNPAFRINEPGVPGASVTQTVPAVLSNIPYKFFKAAIVPVRDESGE